MNINWPSRPTNNLNPAYVIAWRLAWYLPLVVLQSLLLGVVAVGWGPATATSLYYRIR